MKEGGGERKRKNSEESEEAICIAISGRSYCFVWCGVGMRGTELWWDGR